MKWISVKDRLPDEPLDETQEYIIANEDGAVCAAFYIRKDVSFKEVRWYCRNHYTNNVTHWMPLPEPPQED